MTTFLLPTEPITSFDAYMATDTGGAGVRRAQDLGPAATIDEVLRSGLRGRGGGGFPTGQKWAGIAAQTGGRRYLVVTIVAGPEEYLFGEEKAMLEVIEGNEPLPRWLPPHLHGLFATAPQLGWQSHDRQPGQAAGRGSNPTMVNNIETLSNVPHILARGATWYRSMGTSESPGTIVTTVVDLIDIDTERDELAVGKAAVLQRSRSPRSPCSTSEQCARHLGRRPKSSDCSRCSSGSRCRHRDAVAAPE